MYAIDLVDRQLAFDALELSVLAEPIGFCWTPGSIGLSTEHFDARFVLRNQYVFHERRNALVVGEFFAAVISLGRVGEDFDDDAGVRRGVGVFRIHFRRATDHAGVRIRVQFRSAHKYGKFRAESFAAFVFELNVQHPCDARLQSRVRQRSPRHVVHDTVDPFELCFTLFLEGQEFRVGHVRDRCSIPGHELTLPRFVPKGKGRRRRFRHAGFVLPSRRVRHRIIGLKVRGTLRSVWIESRFSARTSGSLSRTSKSRKSFATLADGRNKLLPVLLKADVPLPNSGGPLPNLDTIAAELPATLPVATPRATLFRKDVARREALVASLEQARAHARQGVKTNLKWEQLDQRAETLEAWKERLRRILVSSAADGALAPRDADTADAELLEVIEDSMALPERRIAAAVALSTSSDERARKRVRVAIDSCADDDMRGALEAAAEGEMEESLMVPLRHAAKTKE